MSYNNYTGSYRETTIAYRIFVRVKECERSPARHRQRRKDNVKIGLMKWDGRLWTGLMWLRTGQVAGSSEHGNELQVP